MLEPLVTCLVRCRACGAEAVLAPAATGATGAPGGACRAAADAHGFVIDRVQVSWRGRCGRCVESRWHGLQATP